MGCVEALLRNGNCRDDGEIQPAGVASFVAMSKKNELSSMEAAFPNVAKWVRGCGWIEVGDQDSQGFVTRALDAGGVVFEKTGCRSLAEALSALEQGLAKWFETYT